MDRDSIEYFRNLFEEEMRRLTSGQEIVNEDFHVQAEDMMDEVDMTSAELETSMRMRLRNREVLFLKKIDEALSRIEEGRFGECESCGADIESRRLHARPTTSVCVNCKEEEERRERVHIDGHRHKSLGARLRLA